MAFLGLTPVSYSWSFVEQQPYYPAMHGLVVPKTSEGLRLPFPLASKLQLVLLASFLRPQGASLLSLRLLVSSRLTLSLHKGSNPSQQVSEQKPMAPDHKDRGQSTRNCDSLFFSQLHFEKRLIVPDGPPNCISLLSLAASMKVTPPDRLTLYATCDILVKKIR